MKVRFSGSDGKRALLEALADQWIIRGDLGLAELCADAGQLEEYARGETLIQENAEDNDIFFLLSGEVSIIVNGREVNRRYFRQHVGEMALIDVSARRSATVIARESVVALRITEADFSCIAASRPELWRRFAIELCSRLRQRNSLVRPRNETPIMFIGSSKEGRDIAEAIRSGLDHDPLIVRVWTDGVFGPSGVPIDDLLNQVAEADFATLVIGPDDQVSSRGAVEAAPRDNVVFELGSFMGTLGRQRTFMVKPRGIDLKLPSDLLGVTPLTYDPSRLGDLRVCMGPVCTELRIQIKRLGSR